MPLGQTHLYSIFQLISESQTCQVVKTYVKFHPTCEWYERLEVPSDSSWPQIGWNLFNAVFQLPNGWTSWGSQHSETAVAVETRRTMGRKKRGAASARIWPTNLFGGREWKGWKTRKWWVKWEIWHGQVGIKWIEIPKIAESQVRKEISRSTSKNSAISCNF